MIKTTIYLTFSKILSLIILIVGATFSFYTKNIEVLIVAMSLSAGLSGLKTWSDVKTKNNQE